LRRRDRHGPIGGSRMKSKSRLARISSPSGAPSQPSRLCTGCHAICNGTRHACRAKDPRHQALASLCAQRSRSALGRLAAQECERLHISERSCRARLARRSDRAWAFLELISAWKVGPFPADHRTLLFPYEFAFGLRSISQGLVRWSCSTWGNKEPHTNGDWRIRRHGSIQ
jgi:hypothetical protein